MTDPQPPPEQPRDEPPRRQSWVPRPPQPTSATDFIVICFAVTIATILLILTVGTVVAGVLGADIKSYFAILTSIITSMISALVGYLAGKGQGHIEAEQRQSPPEPPP